MSAAAAAGRGRRVDDHDDLCGPAATPGGALGRGACSPCAPRWRTRANNRAGRDHNGDRSGTPDGNGRTSPRESSRPADSPHRRPVAIFDGVSTPCDSSAWAVSQPSPATQRARAANPGLHFWGLPTRRDCYLDCRTTDTSWPRPRPSERAGFSLPFTPVCQARCHWSRSATAAAPAPA